MTGGATLSGGSFPASGARTTRSSSAFSSRACANPCLSRVRPTGCFLAGRCPLAVDRCRAAMPPAEAVEPGHLVRCYRHRGVAEGVGRMDYFERFEAEAERLLGGGAAAAT